MPLLLGIALSIPGTFPLAASGCEAISVESKITIAE